MTNDVIVLQYYDVIVTVFSRLYDWKTGRARSPEASEGEVLRLLGTWSRPLDKLVVIWRL